VDESDPAGAIIRCHGIGFKPADAHDPQPEPAMNQESVVR
jgi:hypothetical protein